MSFDVLRRAWPLLAIVALSIVGCGGSGANRSPAVGAIDQAGDIAEVASINASLNKLINPTRDSLTQAALAAIKADPKFVASGVATSGIVWGQFADGVYFAVATNDPDLPQSTTTAVAHIKSHPLVVRPAIGLPGSAKAFVFSPLEANRLPPDATIAQELSASGYTVIHSSGKLADWRGVHNAAVVCNISHGGGFPINGLDTYYLESSDVPTSTDSSHMSDLKSHALVIGDVDVIEQP